MKRVNMSALGSIILKEFTTCMCIIVEKFTQNNENIHIFGIICI